MKKILIWIMLFAAPVFATVPAGESIRQAFNCDGSETEFTFTQPFNSSSDVKVYTYLIATGVEELLVESTGYTIAAMSSDYLNGGVVTTTATYASTYRLVIVREIEKTQETTTGMMTPVTAAAALDKISRQIQDLEDRKDRSIHLQESDASTFDMELPGLDGRANSYPYFGSTGELTFVSTVSLGGVSASTYGDTLLQATDAEASLVILGLAPADDFAFTDGVLTGTLTVAGESTFNGNVTLGATSDIDMNSKFTVAGADGNTVIVGTLDVTGVATIADASLLKTSAAPTTDAMIANKKYVDDSISNLSMSAFFTTDSESQTYIKAHAYLSQVDGFVCGFVTLNSSQSLQCYVVRPGVGTDPVVNGILVQNIQSVASGQELSFSFSVAAAEYWEIRTDSTSGTLNILWRGLSSALRPIDQD